MAVDFQNICLVKSFNLALKIHCLEDFYLFQKANNCSHSLKWELILSLSVVSDSAHAGSRKGLRIIVIANYRCLIDSFLLDWSLLSRFGSQILKPAYIASSSKINLDITDTPVKLL